MVWDHSTYSKNRDRLLQADIARKFLKAILEHEKVKPLLSDEHFTVDGTLINAWAPMKSFVARKMAPPDQDTMPPAADGGAPPKTEAKLDLGPRRHCPSPHRPRATARTRRRTPPRCTGPRPRARVATRRSTSTGRSGRSDTRLDHRRGGTPVPQRQGQGGRALLHGPRAHREPPRARGRGRPDAGHRHRRTRGGRHSAPRAG